jgi:hypothetical protein
MNEEESKEKMFKLRILKTRMLKLHKLEAELKGHNNTLFRKVRNTLIAVEEEILKIDPDQTLLPEITVSDAEVHNHQEPFL